MEFTISKYEARFATNFEKGAFYIGVLLGYYLENGRNRRWYIEEVNNRMHNYPLIIKSILPKLYYAILKENLDTEEVKRLFANASEYLAISTEEEEIAWEKICFAFGLGQGLWMNVLDEMFFNEILSYD
jgi:hypothetical protein